MLERKAKLKIGLFCIAVALLLVVVMMAGCSTESQPIHKEIVFYDVRTLAEGSDISPSYVPEFNMWCGKIRIGDTDVHSLSGIGFTRDEPILSDVYSDKPWEEWSWYKAALVFHFDEENLPAVCETDSGWKLTVTEFGYDDIGLYVVGVLEG